MSWLLLKALCWFGGQRKSIRSGLVCFYSLRPVGHGACQQALKLKKRLKLFRSLPKGVGTSRLLMQGMLAIIYFEALIKGPKESNKLLSCVLRFNKPYIQGFTLHLVEIFRSFGYST